MTKPCPSCENQCSPSAAACPSCGHVFRTPGAINLGDPVHLIGLVVLSICFGLAVWAAVLAGG